MTIYDICTCYAWLELAMGRVCGRQANWSPLGGSSGGDNHAYTPVRMLICSIYAIEGTCHTFHTSHSWSGYSNIAGITNAKI